MFTRWLQPLLACAAMAPFVAGAVPVIQHWQTPQGTRVYFVESRDLPILDVRVLLDAGSARDGAAAGVARLTAELLPAGAGRWNADAVAERLAGVGAQLDSGVALDFAYVALRTLTHPDKFKTALDTLHAVVAKPKFAIGDFAREKERALADLKQRLEDPGTVASERFYQTLYGEHPYAQPATGRPDTVGRLARDDVAKFYQRYYTARAAVITIVGDVDRSQAEALANGLAADLPQGDAPALIPPVSPGAGMQVKQPFASAQTHLLLGMPVLVRGDPDFFPLYLGNHILGGGGLVSRLFEEVREKRGLAYSASSYFYPLRQAGPFMVSAQTRNDRAQQSLEVIQQTVHEFIANGPTQQEVDDAKKNLVGGFVLRLDSNAKIIEQVAVIAWYQLPVDYLQTFSEHISAVTREEIADAFKRRVDPQRFVTLLLGGGEAAP